MQGSQDCSHTISPERAAPGVANDMAIFHGITSILLEDGVEDLLWVLAALEGVGIGCMLANIETSQHCFSGALGGFIFCFWYFWLGWILHQFILRSSVSTYGGAAVSASLISWRCMFWAVCVESDAVVQL